MKTHPFSATINKSFLFITLALSLLAGAPATSFAQDLPTEPTSAKAIPAMISATSVGKDVGAQDVYRIGPGDVLEVRVFNRPQLSRDAVRVDGRGLIRLPLLETEIKAACLTEGELATEIARAYLKYQRNPHVEVYVKDFNSQLVAVLGAVRTPGRFQLQRRFRLLELITLAGGPSDRAGKSLEILRTGRLQCETNPEPSEALTPEDEGAVSLSLNDVLSGKAGANPYVQTGDVINLPEADQAYIVGNIVRPQAIVLNEEITLTRAIAMAGGAMPDTKTNKIRIVRQDQGRQTKTELYADLKAINQRRAEDVVLKPGDIIEVPTSSGKSLLRSLLGTIAPTLSQVPVRIIVP